MFVYLTKITGQGFDYLDYVVFCPCPSSHRKDNASAFNPWL